MTCTSDDCVQVLHKIIGDCLDIVKFKDVNLYYELIILRYELFVSDFCIKRFKKWCQTNKHLILANDETLFTKNYSHIYPHEKYLPKNTLSKIWTFLQNSLQDHYCTTCNLD
uniref:Putative Uvr/REP helicase n=1 Tax=Erythrocytic necrosis virus TaxID=1543320 RepID=A0A4D6QI87_9VIRU|nr:putative Uvr/REP helicase [Erythrocytic necrosis virus]